MQIELRDYQKATVERMLARYEQDKHGKGKFVWATGLGKTVGFSAIACEVRKRSNTNVLIIAHRDELLSQAAQKYRYIDPEARIGKVGSGYYEWGCPITVASIQTISRPNHIRNLKQFGFGLVIVDECFPAGTLIDGKPIEQIKAGDSVTAFDETTGKLVKSRVVRTFRNPATQLLRVTSGLKSVICTPNHPFYTRSGWKTASQLTPNEEILYAGINSQLCAMHSTVCAQQKSAAKYQKRQKRVLFRYMPTKTFISNDDKNQSEICLCQNDSQQSYAHTGNQRQNAKNAQSYWSQTQSTRGQWQGSNYSTANASASIGLETDGICSQNEDVAQKTSILSVSLQNRSGFSLAQNSNRDRWSFTYNINSQSARREENGIPHWTRVDSIEILKPGSDGTFGGLCSDGYIYNFEVKQYHTYTANGFIVHNCHHAHSGNEYGKVLRELPDAFKIGCTATDDRLDKLTNEDLFGESVLTMGILDGIEQGYLSRVRAIAIKTGTSLEGLHTKEGDYLLEELKEKIDTPERNQKIVDGYLEHGENRQFMAFTIDIAHGQHLSEAFNQAGVKAVAVSGKTPNRGQILSDFERGKYQILCNCQVFTEGYDAETTYDEDEGRYIFLSGAILARPTKSRGLFTQCIGRILRLAPTKIDALILDATDNVLNHRLEPQTLAKVVGIEDLRDGEDVLEAKERKEKTEREKRERQTKVKRSQDIQIEITARLDWQQKDNGMFVLEVGPQKHRIAIVPSQLEDDTDMWGNAGYYSVWARLAPFYEPQEWLSSAPLDWCQQYAEKRARMLLSDANNIKLVDKNAAWRNYPASDKQIEMLLRFGVVHNPEITKGEAADILDPIFEKLKKKREAKEKVS